MARHHGAFAWYHCTVWRMPVSNAIAGFHPVTRVSLEESTA